jgi:hypothetical protein
MEGRLYCRGLVLGFWLTRRLVTAACVWEATRRGIQPGTRHKSECFHYSWPSVTNPAQIAERAHSRLVVRVTSCQHGSARTLQVAL